MGFSDVLKLYLDKTKCTAKELSAVSGISASALSRYRSGQRIPEQEHLEKLICGLVQLAGENAPEIGEETIRDAFSPYMEKPKLDYPAIIKNFNAAIEASSARRSSRPPLLWRKRCGQGGRSLTP